MIASWTATMAATATISGMFVRQPSRKKLSRSDRTASAWPSWRNASVVNTIVCQCQPTLIEKAWMASVTPPMSKPTHSACCHSPRAKIDSDCGRGGRRIVSGSTGSTPRARAGGPSVTRLIHRMWIGSSGIGRPANGARNITQISAELVVSR